MSYEWFSMCYIFGFNNWCSKNIEREKFYAFVGKRLMI